MHRPIGELNVPDRILLGPGPSTVNPRILRSMSTPLVGYLDPEWLSLMDEEQRLLREIFQTGNVLTFPMSGTGSVGMETAFCNFVEPGERVLIGCNGYFSERMCDMARLYGADVRRIEKTWGGVFTLDEIDAALRQHGPVKLLALIHAETSTGALQPLEGIGALARRHEALLLIDCVTSLGGVPLSIDALGIDIAFSGSQKCLGCPPGLSPFTAGDRALQALSCRKSPVPNWYLDLTMVAQYWGPERVYHHTPSTTLHYGLREGMRIVLEEGLEIRWNRHRATAEYLWQKLECLGIRPFVGREHRLPSLTTVCVPDGADDAAVRMRLRNDYNIDIAGGFGPLKGKIWRIGMMGASSRRENVTLLCGALDEILNKGR